MHGITSVPLIDYEKIKDTPSPRYFRQYKYIGESPRTYNDRIRGGA